MGRYVIDIFTVGESVNTGDQRMLVKVEFPDHMIADDTDECSRQTVLGVCHVARSISWRELDQKIQLVFQVFDRYLWLHCELQYFHLHILLVDLMLAQ